MSQENWPPSGWIADSIQHKLHDHTYYIINRISKTVRQPRQ